MLQVLPRLALLDSRLLIRWRVKVGMWMGWSGYDPDTPELDTRLVCVTGASLTTEGLHTGHLR